MDIGHARRARVGGAKMRRGGATGDPDQIGRPPRKCEW